MVHREVAKIVTTLKILFIIHHISADISGRHLSHYLWVFTQYYLAMPKNVKR